MNWYFADNGTSIGPHSEAEMARLFSRREMPPDALVWHPGMSEWQGLDEVQPEWARPGPDQTPLAGHAEQSRQPEKKTQAASAGPPATTQPAAVKISQQAAAAAAGPSRSSEPPVSSRLRPVAPTPDPELGEKKPGFFQRLFGKGKPKP